MILFEKEMSVLPDDRPIPLIKGAAASIGGERLRKAAFEMEKAADAGDPGAVSDRMEELETQFSRLQEALCENGYDLGKAGAISPSAGGSRVDRRLARQGPPQ